MERVINGLGIPFLSLGNFPGFDDLFEQAHPNAHTANNYSTINRTGRLQSLRDIFDGENVVYRRSELSSLNLNSGMYNASLVTLSQLSAAQYAPAGPTMIDPYYQMQSASDDTLIFESRFESGNLARAVRTSETEYDLLLQNDVNSRGYTQWFFFSVENTKKDNQVTFSIKNLSKRDSLYNHGMKILIYSEKENKTTGRGWFRGGKGILYYQNNIAREAGRGGNRTYQTLTWKYKFKHDNDRVFFAHSYPYTFTELNEYLDYLEKDDMRCQHCHISVLAKTLAGNNCKQVTITNRGSYETVKNRRGVIISARVHPGETIGSWMMKGALDFLTGPSQEAYCLREKYVFKVIPMLNPDGVINGNYRCSLVGQDLNRRWKDPSKQLHPVIYAAKRVIKSFATNRKIDLVIDFHGHSRRKNMFAYGCNIRNEPHVCKAFPFILSKVSSCFDFRACRFSVTNSKSSTQRIVMFKELKWASVYTIEGSFWGPSIGKFANKHFTRQILMDCGKDICWGLIINASREPDPPKTIQSDPKRPQGFKLAEPGELELLDQFSGTDILSELLESDELLHQGEGKDSSGSDSEPSDDNLDPEDLSLVLPKSLVKKQKKRATAQAVVANASMELPKKQKMPKPTSFTPKQTPKTTKARLQSIATGLNSRMRCERCGEFSGPNHLCRRAVRQIPLSQRTGIKTYYNPSGLLVHDQETQTPSSFYPRAGIKVKKDIAGPIPQFTRLQHRQRMWSCSPQKQKPNLDSLITVTGGGRRSDEVTHVGSKRSVSELAPLRAPMSTTPHMGPLSVLPQAKRHIRKYS